MEGASFRISIRYTRGHEEMKKEQFLNDLGLRLACLPYADRRRSLDYYREMIDDRMEDGLSEEEAVQKIGTPAMAATQIMQDLPLTTLARARVGGKKSGLTITLIIMASPIWISLLAVAFSLVISAFAVLFAVLAVFFTLFVSLWAAEIGFTVGAVAGIVGCPFFIIFQGEAALGIFLLGAGFILAALAIFGYYGAIYGTKGLRFLFGFVFKLYGLILKFIKSLLIRKETIR